MRKILTLSLITYCMCAAYVLPCTCVPVTCIIVDRGTRARRHQLYAHHAGSTRALYFIQHGEWDIYNLVYIKCCKYKF